MSRPEEWKWQPINEILERINDPVIVEPNELYQEIGIRSHGKGIFHKKPASGKQIGNKRVFKIYPDCFIVNIVFAWEQAVARTTNSELGMIASHRFPMYRPLNEKCDIDYIVYFFKSSYGKYLLELASPGGAGRNKTLGQKEFSNLKLILPPINEQRKIAEILSKWDQAINLYSVFIDKLKSLKNGVLQKTFSANNTNEVMKLRDCTNYLSRGETPTYSKTGEWYSVNQKCIRWNKLEPKSLKSCAPLKEKYLDSVIRENDILINSTGDGTIGRALVANSFPTNYFADSHITIVRTKNILSPKYLVACLESSYGQNEIYRLITGSTGQSELSPKNLGAFRIPLANLKDQLFITNFISQINTCIDYYSQLKSLLITQKNGLSQKLLLGKIRTTERRDN